ncbi:MAG TPA: hypothetical protein VLA14_01875 [Polyangia bacterium]|nr:hypothetical protein [Polyangia bacterium]
MNTRNRPSAKVFLGLVVSIVVPTLSACGGGGGSPLTVDDFCTQKAAAECGVASLCAVSATDCETVRKAACTSFVATVNIAPRVFVPGNVAACVSKTKSVYAEALIKPADLDAVVDICNFVFQGPAAELAACTTKYDCKNEKDLCDKGHCATQTNVAANAQCANFGQVCPTTQYCSTVAAAMMCVAKGALGAACDATTPCDATKMLTCGAAGMCVMQSASGGACTTDADCLAAAPYCNPYAGNRCGAGLTFSAGSASCSAYGGTASATGTAGATGTTDGAAGATGAAGAGGSDASTTDAADAATTG